MQRVICVPGDWVPVLVRVNECDRRCEIVVVLYYIGEVCICFCAFIPEGAEGAVGHRVEGGCVVRC